MAASTLSAARGLHAKLSSSACARRSMARFTRSVASKAAATVESPTNTYQGLDLPEDVKPLFQPWTIGRYELAHRIVYAPLTRCRSFNTIPQPIAAEYYSQRTSEGGLLISEATCICSEAHGYPNTPGIYTQEHIEAWKPIVKAVHDKGGRFFLQLWHVGRASHPDYQPGGAAPVSSTSTPISEAWPVFTPKGGPFKYLPPRPLTEAELPAIVAQYAQAAKNAIEAGFDGVEVHGANGYLIDQFLKDGINDRTDSYGGPVENRIRLALEVTQAVVDAVGADRTGIRLSPFQTFLDASDSAPYTTTMALVEKLNPLGLAYVHMVEPRVQGNENVQVWHDSLLPFRAVSKAPFIAAGGHNRGSGAEAVRSGEADAVAYGRLFLANPDMPKRFILDAPLNPYDRNTFYSQGPEGYVDYPTLEQLQAKQ